MSVGILKSSAKLDINRIEKAISAGETNFAMEFCGISTFGGRRNWNCSLSRDSRLFAPIIQAATFYASRFFDAITFASVKCTDTMQFWRDVK